jgi:hypothetical protein
MITRPPPHFDPRKRKQLLEELTMRARLWLPEWRQGGSKSDPIAAVLAIAAKLNAEVTQRLDRVPEKSFRGMLHWLGKRGQTGRAARLPAVFGMLPGNQPVLAVAPVQLQADAAGTPVIFETETSLRLTPAKLEAVFAASPTINQFYQAAPGLDGMEAPPPTPDDWRLRVPAPIGDILIQLDPPEGLSPGMLVHDDAQNRYRIVAANDGLVTLSHGIGTTANAASPQPAPPSGTYNGWLHRANAFSPFDGNERNLQEHALYLGADEKLDIKTLAAIELVGDIPPDAEWSYWGKAPGGPESAWQTLEPVPGIPNTFVKGQGEIEKREINGTKLRWLRAIPHDPDKVSQQIASNIRFKINCHNEEQRVQAAIENMGKKDSTAGIKPKIDIEAIANTTPVVLDRGFYPFGREPRVFDAFYLSCPEAFAKPNAFADITLKVGEAFSGPLNAVGDMQSTLVAGIGKDRKPRLILHTPERAEGALQFLPVRQPLDDNGLPVNFISQKMGAAIFIDSGFSFTATDGTDVWHWATGGTPTNLTAEQSHGIGWRSLGHPPTDDPIVETVMLHDGVATCEVLALLLSGAVYTRPSLGGVWTVLPIRTDNGEHKIDRLVRFDNTSLPPSRETPGNGLAAVTRDGGLIYRDWNGNWKTVKDFETTPTTRGEHPTTAPYPLALWHNEDLHLYARGLTMAGAVVLGAVRIDYSAADPVVQVDMPEPLVGDGFGFFQEEFKDPAIIFALEAGASARLALWQPFTSKDPYIIAETMRLLSVEQPPVRLTNGVLFPLERGDVAPAAGPFVYERKAASLLKGIALPQQMPPFQDANVLLEITDAELGFAFGDRIEPIGYEFAAKRPKSSKNPAATKIHRIGPQHACAVTLPYTIELVEDDVAVMVGATLCISRRRPNDVDRLVTVKSIVAQQDGPRIATVNEEISGNTANRFYHVVKATYATSCKIRPTIVVDPSFALPDDTAPERMIIELHAARFEFHTTLERRPITANDSARLIVEDGWPKQPLPKRGDMVRLVSMPTLGASVSGPSPRNPEISWEYWNGASWWQIRGVTDTTQHLVRTGHVKFCAPPDLKELEVVGRKGHWIRARLVGGDYGQETVTVENVPPGKDGKTGQIVKRDASTIRAPYIVSIDVQYNVCCAIAPSRVLTLDNGAYVDQTDVNGTQNAVVAVFTPLRMALPSAIADSSAQDRATTNGAPYCKDCEAPNAAAVQQTPGSDLLQQAIYLGFSEKLQGASIALLFLVEETGQTSELPLEVDAYAGNAFKPIQVVDETRALTETGVLTIDCPEPLQQVSYFGRSLYWLRLKPPAKLQKWNPRITGIHINGVWATAAETWKREIVGQSDGSPSQGFNLTHAPVLADTLELRVREPLGDDEKDELANAGQHDVQDEIELWQGPWVRWLSGDLATAGPLDRIFDFDPSVGVITFGDGFQGAIPPIGNDNIVAVEYRSGGRAAANNVPAWSKLNLIGPLPGVEQVVTPQGAAGGSDTQDAATALRFASGNIATRDRIVTLADFELFALQFSPDIAQAKAFAQAQGVRLVVIMRGRTQVPSNAVRRELARRLRDNSAPALRRPGALIVEGPHEVPVGITVELSVVDLAQAGVISEAVQASLRGLLDPGTGGLDGRGWPLGAAVTETHISAAIADIASIEEIASIRIVLAAPLSASQIAVLPEDGLAIQWRQAQTEAA